MKKILFHILFLLFFISFCSRSFSAINPEKEGFDRFMYIGSGAGFFPLVDPRRHATSPMGTLDLYWGSDWNRQLGFDGTIYRLAFKEDVTQRPFYYLYDGHQQIIYDHVGVRLRGLLYLGDKKVLRLRPIFSKFTIFLPYVFLGAALEPTIAVKDYAHLPSYGSRFWGVGLNEGFGFLELFRDSNFRLRYEGNLLQSFSGQTKGFGVGSFFDMYARVALEYSFYLKSEANSGVHVAMLTGHQMKDNNQLDRFLRGGRDDEGMSSTQLSSDRNGVNLRVNESIALFFQKDSKILNDSNYFRVNQFFQKRNPAPLEDMRLLIVGFSEDTGDQEKDLLIARERTLSVERYFINQGVPAEKIRYSWHVNPIKEAKIQGMLLPTPASQKSKASLANQVVVRRLIYAVQPSVLLSAPEKTTENPKAKNKKEAVALLRRHQKSSQVQIDSDFAKRERRVLLQKYGLRYPTDADKKLVAGRPSELLRGNQPGKFLALDTKVHESYESDSKDASPSLKASTTKATKDTKFIQDQYLVGSDVVLDRINSAPSTATAFVKSYTELYDLSAKVSIVKKENPKIQDFIPRGYWFKPFQKRSSSLTKEDEKWLLNMVQSIKTLKPNQRLLFITSSPSKALQKRYQSVIISRQENLMQYLIDHGVSSWRLVDNTYQFVNDSAFNKPFAPENKPLISVVKSLYQDGRVKPEVYQNSVLLWVVVEELNDKTQTVFSSEGSLVDINSQFNDDG